MEYLSRLDTKSFIFLNGLHCAFLDPIMYWFSNKLIWLPMYLLITFFILRHYRKKGLFILLFIGVLILLCDQAASHLIKNAVQRLRPSHDPALTGLVHLGKAGAGGIYGFVSSHAANTFGLATFLAFVLNRQFRWLKYWLFLWAILVSYSRIYNGVHYPGDILGGAFLGFCIGYILAKIYLKTGLRYSRTNHRPDRKTSKYCFSSSSNRDKP